MHLDFVLKGNLIIKLISFMETDIQLVMVCNGLLFVGFFFFLKEVDFASVLGKIHLATFCQ